MWRSIQSQSPVLRRPYPSNRDASGKPICRHAGTWFPLCLTTQDFPFIRAQGRLGLSYVAAPLLVRLKRLGRVASGADFTWTEEKSPEPVGDGSGCEVLSWGESCAKLVQFGDEVCAPCPVGPRRARG